MGNVPSSPLPNRRPRALTLPYYPSTQPPKLFQKQKMQKADPQSISPLFALLPFELRQEIYRYILLGWDRSPIVHINQMKTRLAHFRCQIEKEDFPCDGTNSSRTNTSCSMLWNEVQGNLKLGWGGSRMDWYFRKGMNDDLLPILQSCMMM